MLSVCMYALWTKNYSQTGIHELMYSKVILRIQSTDDTKEICFSPRN